MNALPIILLEKTLAISRCPHCDIAKPYLFEVHSEYDEGSTYSNPILSKVYKCSACHKLVTAWGYAIPRMPMEVDVVEFFPPLKTVDSSLPKKAAAFLNDAIATVAHPSACVMACASSIDEMLKQRGLTEGTLNTRINEAKKAGILTEDMAIWAHKIRLDANDQRHADLNADIPTVEQAKQLVEFAEALADLLFVLPAKMKESIEQTLKRNTPFGRGAR